MLASVRRCSPMLLVLLGCICAAAQEPEDALKALVTTGQVTFRGQTRQYIVRHLPPSSYPGLPEAVAGELNRRGCLIPQTYAAHQPENAVQGSFQRADSTDWAVLCSVNGAVSLLVFFGGSANATVLAASPEIERLQPHDSSGVLGFNWGIDAASPQAIHDARKGMSPRPARLDHDALADSIVDRKTIFHYFADNGWSLLDMPD
jgi:hypothetical protein